jgi:V/A-type H+/Na+-transporting ATPase subunit F
MSSEAAHTGRGEAAAGRVGVMGRPDVIAPFRAAGFAVFPVEPGAGACARVEELVEAGLSVLFYTEDLYPYLADFIARCSRTATPCLVMLPMGAEQRGFARLREIVRRTVGADVFARGPAEARAHGGPEQKLE